MPESPSQSGTVELSGRVIDDRTGLPVTLFAMQWGESGDPGREIVWGYGLSATATPVPDGNFHASHSCADGRKVSMQIVADGYLPQTVTKPLAAGARITGLVVRLRRGFEIRGAVLDHTGAPVPSARVYLTGNMPLRLVNGNVEVFRGSRAATDALGRFVLTGADASAPGYLVVTAGRGVTAIAARPALGEKVTIRLGKPARLLVRYAIPEESAKAALNLNLATWQMENWRQSKASVRIESSVRNGGEIEITLSPGVYDFTRQKIVWIGNNESRGYFCDRRTIVLADGEIQTVDIGRQAGHVVEGDIPALKETGAETAIVSVRGPDATGDPRNPKEIMSLFAVQACTAAHFRTAPLAPGSYTVVVEAYLPEKPWARFNTAIRLPAFVGTAKVTIAGDRTPSPVSIALQPVK